MPCGPLSLWIFMHWSDRVATAIKASIEGFELIRQWGSGVCSRLFAILVVCDVVEFLPHVSVVGSWAKSVFIHSFWFCRFWLFWSVQCLLCTSLWSTCVCVNIDVVIGYSMEHITINVIQRILLVWPKLNWSCFLFLLLLVSRPEQNGRVIWPPWICLGVGRRETCTNSERGSNSGPESDLHMCCMICAGRILVQSS